MLKEYVKDMKREFTGYNSGKFMKDVLAGITVAAVALPLALAFGVASGMDAAAGLITAIIAALIIGSLSGASYQISGPTGAMAAILIPLATKHGVKTVLVAGALSGVLLILAGVFRAGRVIGFLPKPIITGFTSGIAVIIALGQVENFLGVTSHGEASYMKVINIFREGLVPNVYAITIGLFTILLMALWPKKWGAKVPASLVGIILTIIAQLIFKFPVQTVGEIPQTLIHKQRLLPSDLLGIPWEVVLMPAISIAALGMIESLLCGAVAGKMSGEKLRNDRELVAQGVGNLLIPFFGGVPATAAIARTSVALKSGAVTRMTGWIQGLVLLLSMFFLSPFMSQIPMAALAGVLIMTAWRMNEWESIHYIFSHKFKAAMVKFTVTLVCTVVFDLTIAIAVGCFIAMFLFVVRAANLEVTVSEIDPERMELGDEKMPANAQVVYLTGPIFFGTAEAFAEKLQAASAQTLILSMRGVANVDTSGVQEILRFCQEKQAAGGKVLFCGVQEKVRTFFDRAEITKTVGASSYFWEAREALKSLTLLRVSD
ncbi:SulP family inorganic anion transporter [Ohessyouella blattaphilus]|uniref:SulP family inorganic anion transporter n=1 Tax=Ohessyouella blattaphilus TaxID=2949333 RepID=A0ABT1EKZ1_9FIRM|nr:SulP family inorganic anion transporter [Ohessyouella blattaphilus]MCP1111367.1 SulP family inorganic anion transporter [Ohessyouella blattaphilus]MCR8564761.1 SulP family inorganic anion transporter [Ohessyouella blattaphilus]